MKSFFSLCKGPHSLYNLYAEKDKEKTCIWYFSLDKSKNIHKKLIYYLCDKWKQIGLLVNINEGNLKTNDKIFKIFIVDNVLLYSSMFLPN